MANPCEVSFIPMVILYHGTLSNDGSISVADDDTVALPSFPHVGCAVFL